MMYPLNSKSQLDLITTFLDSWHNDIVCYDNNSKSVGMFQVQMYHYS